MGKGVFNDIFLIKLDKGELMDNSTDFTQGSIFKKLIKFMLPILGALILQAMYGAVDLLVVGRFGTSNAISAVSTGSSAVNFVVFTTAGLSMALTVLISRYIGEKDYERIGRLIGSVICFFVIWSMAIMILLLILAPNFASLLSAPDEAFDLTVQYIRICGGGIIFIIAYNVISAIMRGLGDSKLPFLFVLIACIVNIIGDLLFVAVFNMNVAGAALATVLAQAVSVILSLIILIRRKLPFSISKKDIRFNSEIKRFIRVGAPMALQELLTNLSFLALLAFINKLGLDASSGYGVANKLVSFILLIPSSLMQSMSSFVGQNVGAGKENRARKGMVTGMGIGVCFGIVIVILCVFFGNVISSVFTTEEAYIAQSWAYLKGFCPEAIATSFLFSFMGFYNGHEKSLFVMAQSLAQTFFVRLPVAYYMSIQPNASLTKIGFAAPCATCFGILLCGIYYIIYLKNFNKKSVF